MKVMIVGSPLALRRKLLTWVPLSGEDQVLEASGMLSALWYAGNCPPDLIVLDRPSCEGSGTEMVELFSQVLPNACVLADEPEGVLEPLVRDAGMDALLPESFFGRPFDAAAWRDVGAPFAHA